MTLKFKISKNPYCTKKNLFTKDSLTIFQGVTVLVGANGSGKSTLLRQIKERVDENKEYIKVYYNNYTDGGHHRMSQQGFYGNTEYLATAVMASEGEQISMSMGIVAQQCGQAMKMAVDKGKKGIIIMLDAIDSGYDIKNMNYFMTNFLPMIFKDSQKNEKEMYVILTTNSYELAAGQDCIDVTNLKNCKFNSYKEYRKYILGE